MSQRFFVHRRSVLAGALALAAPWGRAQPAFPSRPVRLLVGYAAGGGVDAMARMLSARLPEILGQPVVVENRAGASGTIAADLVARSAADGHTLLLGESALLIAPHLGIKTAIDPLQSFAPVAGAFQAPLMIVANNAVQASTPREFIALLKANPGRYSYATPGIGTVQHLGMEIVKSRAGVYVLHIPYRGASQVIPDVISGQVPFAVVSAAAGLAQVRGGKLKAIAMMSTAPLPGAEQVAPLADALPGFDVAPRVFVLAPAGTPGAVVIRLNDAIRSVLTSPELAQMAAQQGGIPAYAPPAALKSQMASEAAGWAEVIRRQKVTLAS